MSEAKIIVGCEWRMHEALRSALHWVVYVYLASGIGSNMILYVMDCYCNDLAISLCKLMSTSWVTFQSLPIPKIPLISNSFNSIQIYG